MGQYIKSLSTQPMNPDFLIAASAGLVADVQVLFQIGHVPGVASGAVNIDVCEQGTLYPFLTSAQTLKISSASANDAAAGTGQASTEVSAGFQLVLFRQNYLTS